MSDRSFIFTFAFILLAIGFGAGSGTTVGEIAVAAASCSLGQPSSPRFDGQSCGRRNGEGHHIYDGSLPDDSGRYMYRSEPSARCDVVLVG